MDKIDQTNTNYSYTDSDEKEISLQDIIYIMRRRMFWIIGIFVVTVAAVLVYLFMATPIFESSVTMRVQPSESGASFEAMLTGAPTSSQIATEVELIKSRSNIEGVINRLGLYEQFAAEYEAEGEEPPSMARLVRRLSNRISVSTVRDTNIVNISVEHPDPAMAQDIANTLAEVYNDMLKAMSQREFQTRREFIERQIPELEADLMMAEENLRRFKEQEGMVLLDEEARILLNNISSFDRQIAPLRIQQENTRNNSDLMQNLIRQHGGEFPALSEIRERSDIQDLESELISLRLELASTVTEGGASTAAQGGIAASITSRENQLKNLLQQYIRRYVQAHEDVPRDYYGELASQYASLVITDTKVSYLTSLRQEYSAQVGDLPRVEQRMLELQREVKVKESLYLLVLERLEETKIIEAGITGTAAMIDDAVIPEIPVAPNKRLILAVGSLLGLFLGVLIAFLVETLDNTLRDEESIKRVVGADTVILGRIPRVSIPTKGVEELLVYSDPTSPGAEAMKLISTNIMFSRVKPPQVIASSSSEMGEGKTTITANFGVAMAQNGFKTIIVDADMRRPRIEQIFDIHKMEGGVVNYLLQNKEISSLIKKPFEDLPNLHVLPVGPLPPNPTAVLTSEKFRRMIEGLRKVYDRIVLDLPPLLVASDGMICSRLADGMVLVVRAGSSTKRGVHMAMETVRGSQISLLGVVINDITSSDSGYYHYYYYYSSRDDSKSGKRTAKRQARKAMKQDKRKSSSAKLTAVYQQEQDSEHAEANEASEGRNS